MREREILKTIGGNIRVARRSAGLTQECLAELVGLHWQTVSNIERGIHPFAITIFASICQHLEVSPEKLLVGIPPPDMKRATRIRKALGRKRRTSES